MPAGSTELSKILGAYSDSDQVLALLTHAVGRAIERDFINQGQPIGWEETEIISHVADWLTASVIENDEWLGRADEQGRPLKLMKLGSLEAAAKEADKAMRKRAQKLRAVKINDGDEELFRELADGYYLVRMLTPEALDVESASMQHCIGQGSYDGLLMNSEFAFYSLRDPFGKPHATLEVESGWLHQCQGKQNRTPGDKYFELMLPVFVEHKWKTRIPMHGVIVDSKHVIHDPMRLPDGFESAGNLKLSRLPITSLPNDMIVGGNLDIRETMIDSLPDGLSVDGTVLAQGTPLSRLGERITVARDLMIQDTNVDALPADIKIKGSLIARNTKLETIPEKFGVGMNVDFGKTPLRSLPTGFVVVGSLAVDECPNLTELPQHLRVARTLNVERTPISRISEGTKIGGLLAAGSSIVDLGAQRMFERLDLSETPFKRLPDGVKVLCKRGTGALKLVGCPLEYVGPGLHVIGRADFRNTPLKHIPGDIFVRGELILSGSQLETVPAGLSVAGTLDISHTGVKLLPRGLRVKGALVARGLQDLVIGHDIFVGKLLDVSEAGVVSWAAQGTIGSLLCHDATIDEMPKYLKLVEFDGDGASIANWPARMTVEGNFRYQRGKTGIMPAVLTVGKNIDCEDTSGVATPETLLVGGRARFKRSRFKSYPAKLEAKSGDFRISTIRQLPKAWRIEEHLLMTNSKLERIEGGLSIGGDFHFDGTPLRNRQELEGDERPSPTTSVRFAR